MKHKLYEIFVLMMCLVTLCSGCFSTQYYDCNGNVITKEIVEIAASSIVNKDYNVLIGIKCYNTNARYVYFLFNKKNYKGGEIFVIIDLLDKKVVATSEIDQDEFYSIEDQLFFKNIAK